MTRRNLLLGAAALALIGIGVLAVRGFWTSDNSGRARAQTARVVPVEVGKALRKKVPVKIEALGSATPMASVALKARLETAIVGVHFTDGASVKEGDLLFTLDCRQI